MSIAFEKIFYVFLRVNKKGRPGLDPLNGRRVKKLLDSEISPHKNIIHLCHICVKGDNKTSNYRTKVL